MAADANIASPSIWLNPAFWAVLVSFTALILSQLPPLRYLVRRTKVTAHLYNRILISHRFGTPFALIHIALNNPGGREIKINGIKITFKPSAINQPEFTVKASSYESALIK